MSEILVSAKIPFVNLNLSRISAETKISDLSKISAEIWLRLKTFCESGPSTSLSSTLYSLPAILDKTVLSQQSKQLMHSKLCCFTIDLKTAIQTFVCSPLLARGGGKGNKLRLTVCLIVRMH